MKMRESSPDVTHQQGEESCLTSETQLHSAIIREAREGRGEANRTQAGYRAGNAAAIDTG